MFKLTPEQARTELVRALRSGEYQKSIEALRDDTGFCPLGLACELYRKIEDHGGWRKPSVTIRDLGAWDGNWSWEFVLNDNRVYAAYPPVEVVDWLGFKDTFGSLISSEPGGNIDTLVQQGCSFEEIAQKIEDGKVATK